MRRAELLNRLEACVDSVSLGEVVSALAEIAVLKAEHLTVNWQDRWSAKVWERASRLLDQCAAKIDV